MQYNVNLILSCDEVDEILGGLAAKKKILTQLESKIYNDATNQVRLIREAEEKTPAMGIDESNLEIEKNKLKNKKGKK